MLQRIFDPRFAPMTMRELDRRADFAAATVQVEDGTIVVIQGCDESEDEAIARAGAESWTGTIVLIRRFTMTAAECAAS